MATTAQTTFSVPAILQKLALPFVAVAHALDRMHDLSERSARLERLSAQTDAQLAAQNLSRQDLVRYVFADYLND